jgi:isoleucyl-tRNA synthetase
MYPSMMPMMGPMMPFVAGPAAVELTAEQQRAALETQKQHLTRVKEAAEVALAQIEDELAAVDVDVDDKEAVAKQRKAQLAADASQLRAQAQTQAQAQVQAQTQAVDLQAQALTQQAQYDRMRLANQNYLNDRRQWVAGGDDFGRPVM